MTSERVGGKKGLLAWLKGTDSSRDRDSDIIKKILSVPPSPSEIAVALNPGGGPVRLTDVAKETLQSQLTLRLVDKGEIARGGMGSVRRIFDNNLQRYAAMKVLFPEHKGDPLLVKRFAEEAQITGQLDHPNIVPVHDFGADDEGTHYMTMKLVQGKTLTELLRSNEDEPGSREAYFKFLSMFLKVCDAVAFAHSRGVIHRDLKPDNIMIGSFGQVYLMDWGIAKLLGRAGPSFAGEVVEPVRVLRADAHRKTDADGAVIGTFFYMSPEQANAQLDLINERTDIFLLGAVLYEILTGVPPYFAETAIEVVMQAQKASPRPPDVMAPELNIPPGLVRICMKALSREQADRYQTALELKDDVETFLRGGASFPATQFPAGTLLMAEGETGQRVFIINKGTVQIFKTKDGRRQGIATVGAGSVVGEASVLSDKPRSASVIAIDDVSATSVSKEQLDRELGFASWMGALVKALADRFVDVDQKHDATRSELRRVQVANWSLQYLLLYGVDGESGTREVRWSALLASLVQQFKAHEAEMTALVDSAGTFSIDAARDALCYGTRTT